MIKLKTGEVVPYNEDFDGFFQELITSIIKTSLRTATKSMVENDDADAFDKHLLKEIMDNCIYVVHQIKELAKEKEELAPLLITGCLFNCTVMNLSHLREASQNKSDDTIH